MSTLSMKLEKLRTNYSQYKGGRPPYGMYEAARFLVGGDGYLMVEFGDKLNVLVNCKVIAFSEELKKNNISGIIEVAPAQLSALIHYDSTTIEFEEFIAKLKDVEQRIPPLESMIVPSRIIEIPVFFNDKWTHECRENYIKTIHPVENDCDVVIKYNGLKDMDELIEYVTTPEHWTTNVGFTPGNANAFPLDPRYELKAPKYNPARSWTYDGTLGIGGGDKVIYPLKVAGGYQMLGRSPIRVYDPKRRNPIFKESPVLQKVGDRQKFCEISEEEYLAIEKERDENYRYRIVNYELFSVKRYMGFLEEVKDEAEEIRRNRPWSKR